MANFVRRLVSGNKARFKDKQLDLELDLVYITDQIVVMGFPAAGVARLYRNDRTHAQRFLTKRHGRNFWVFNFCPLTENAYPPEVFDGRVSRFPFPDHHAPPFALIPLVVREMHAWLSGSPDRVAVLHCKAGKGRSGTIACAYLLSLTEAPAPPQLPRNLSSKERKAWEKKRREDAAQTAEEMMQLVETDVPGEGEVREEVEGAAQDMDSGAQSPPRSMLRDGVETEELANEQVDTKTTLPVPVPPPPPQAAESTPKPSHTLDDVLALHTARRMRPPSPPNKSKGNGDGDGPNKVSDVQPKPKQGVSIPSQRRFLRYWALILGGAAPPNFWGLPSVTISGLGDALGSAARGSTPGSTTGESRESVGGGGTVHYNIRLTRLTVRMRALSGVQKGLVSVANALFERAGGSAAGKGKSGLEPEEAPGERKTKKNGTGPVWASLARYDDAFVETLERWERHTRDAASVGDGYVNMSFRRPGSETTTPVEADEGETALRDLFTDGQWDGTKMVRAFARMGCVKGAGGVVRETTEQGEVKRYTLRPLGSRAWRQVRKEIAADAAQPDVKASLDVQGVQSGMSSAVASDTDLPIASVLDVSRGQSPAPDAGRGENAGAGRDGADAKELKEEEEGIIIDADREVRVKLHMGPVFMGWFWFIPTFHMPQPPPLLNSPGANAERSQQPQTHFTLTRKEVDFPLGAGTALVDVDVEMAWLPVRE